MTKDPTEGNVVVNARDAGRVGREVWEDRSSALLVLDDIAAEDDTSF